MSKVFNLEIYRNIIGGDPLNRIIHVKRMIISVMNIADLEKSNVDIYIKFIKIH